MIGNNGRDTLEGSSGNDSLVGGAGDDTLYGADGNDTLKGDSGNDLLNGGDGDDLLFGDEGNDTIDGGEGEDTVVYDDLVYADDRDVVSITEDIVEVDGADTLTNVEFIEFADTTVSIEELKNPVVEPPNDDTTIRVNAGKDDVYTDSLGLVWSANDGLSGGRSYANSNEIAQTDNDLLYQSEYYGQNFSYSQDVPNGNYDVTLHFAETVFYQPGRRVFDVSAEDQLILDNFDIIDEAGGQDIAIERIFTVGVSDGTLDLDFLAEVNNAKISAIEIKPSII